MKTTQGSMLHSLRAARTFLDDNAEVLGDIRTTGARKDLDVLIADLDGHAATQTGSLLDAKGSTQRQRALRQALLRDHIAPIVKIAAAKKLTVAPGLTPLRMPRGRPTAERLAVLAHGMGETANKYAAIFTSTALPADFVARLDNAADAMIAAVDDRTQSHGLRKRSTTGLQLKLSQGRQIVAVLDALVKSALKDDPVRLAEWNVVKRVRVIPTRPALPVAPTGASAEPSNPPTH